MLFFLTEVSFDGAKSPRISPYIFLIFLQIFFFAPLCVSRRLQKTRDGRPSKRSKRGLAYGSRKRDPMKTDSQTAKAQTASEGPSRFSGEAA